MWIHIECKEKLNQYPDDSMKNEPKLSERSGQLSTEHIDNKLILAYASHHKGDFNFNIVCKCR